MLISHYAALCGQTETVTGMVGTVDQDIDLTQVARFISKQIIMNKTNIFRAIFMEEHIPIRPVRSLLFGRQTFK